jgi:hypothetical protein
MARRKQDSVSETTMDAEPAVPVDRRDELDEQLAEQLKAQGTSLVGPDGLLGRLTKPVVQARANRW